jgi:hypothetical protein
MDNMTKWVIFEMVIKMISSWVIYIYTIIEYASLVIKMKYDEVNMIELVLLWDFMVISELSHSCDFRDDDG